MPDAFLLPDLTRVAVTPVSDGTLSFTHENHKWLAIISPVTSWSSPTLANDSISFVANENGLLEGPDFIVYTTLYYYFSLLHPTPAANSRPGAPRQIWSVLLNLFTNSVQTETVLQYYNQPLSSWGDSIFTLGNLETPKALSVHDTVALLESKGVVLWLPQGSERQPIPRIAQPALWQLDAGFTVPVSSGSPLTVSINSSLQIREKLATAVYTFTNGVRHPIRRRTGFAVNGTLYRRYIPQLKSILTLRLASIDDTALVNNWMNNPRVAKFWGEEGDLEKTRKFLEGGLALKHSFPVIGSWEEVAGEGDGMKPSGVVEPFGYFEVYWVKEDRLGQYTDAEHWDRGVHVLVGEEKFRGPQRVRAWLGSLVHYMFLDDARTHTVMLEPRIDNEKFINYLQKEGFYKEKEVTFPHKQSALVKLKREAWEGPAV